MGRRDEGEGGRGSVIAVGAASTRPAPTDPGARVLVHTYVINKCRNDAQPKSEAGMPGKLPRGRLLLRELCCSTGEQAH